MTKTKLFEGVILNKIKNSPEEYIEIISGDIHREVGGYPGRTHSMPVCCNVMYRLMTGNDEVLKAPPSGKGASLRVRYYKSNHR